MRARQRLDLIHDHPDFALARAVIERLGQDGAQTLLAGGGVRDALLGVAPKDLDLATSALPGVTQASFARTVDVGKAFGTIIVVEGGRQLEVTTFRREDEYRDGRRPSSVTFTDAREDASRRDFTVNAIFYDPLTETVIDHEHGRADLAARTLRTVGDPRRRFTEDRLRLLRAVRFVGQLGFTLAPETAAAVRAEAPALAAVAAERVLAEMRRLLTAASAPLGLRAARDLGVLDVIWPEFNDRFVDHRFETWENAFAAHAWAAGPDAAAARLAAWKSPNETRRRVIEQMRAVRTLLDPGAPGAARLRALGAPWADDVRRLAELIVPADRLAPALAAFAKVATPAGTLPRPFLDGADLGRLGVAPGARMGEYLKKLYDAQLEGRLSGPDDAAACVRTWLNE